MESRYPESETRSVPSERWDELCAAHPLTPVFATSSWLSVLGDVFRRQPEYFLATDANGNSAGVPVLPKPKGPLRLSPPLPISLYSGFLDGNANAHLLRSLFGTLEKSINFIHLNLPPNFVFQDFLRDRGWHLRKQNTIVQDISDFSKTWSSYNQSLRRKIRRASERGYRLEESVDLDLVVRLHHTSYDRHGMKPPISADLLSRWLKRLLEAGLIRVFLARTPAGDAPACRIVICDGKRCYDWLAGARSVQGFPAASHWLVSAIMEQCSEDGCTTFDFMGANTPGIIDFKRSFGGDLVNYWTAAWYRPALLEKLETLKRSLMQRSRRLR